MVPGAEIDGSTCPRHTERPRVGECLLEVIRPMMRLESPSTIWQASAGTIEPSSGWRATRTGRSVRS